MSKKTKGEPTRPRQAASPSTVDKWQRELRLIVRVLYRHRPILRLRPLRRLERLIESMARAERRL